MKKKLLSIFTALVIVLCIAPVTAVAQDPTGDFTVTGGTLDTDYTYANNVLTVISATPLTISGTTTSDRIEVAGGVDANITFAGLNIDVSQKSNTPAFRINDVGGVSTGEVTVTIADNTTNVLKSGRYWAGLTKVNGSDGNFLNGGLLKIRGETNGTGKLEAIGGENAAGIGGSYGFHSSNIYITNCNVSAIGGQYGAGIGGGWAQKGTNITISGANVTATGGLYAAGIGGGNSGSGENIVISGGSVKASSVSCTVKDGNGVDVYPLTLANPDGNDVFIDNATTPYNPSNHTAVDSSDTNLYVYLPAKSLQDPHVVRIGNKSAKYYYETAEPRWVAIVDTAYTGDFTVTGGIPGKDYTYTDNILTVLSATPLTISGTTTTDHIVVARDVNGNITLAGVNISVGAGAAPLMITNYSKGNVTIILADGTENILTSNVVDIAGLAKNSDVNSGTLTIKGNGKLTASGLWNAAGIGSNGACETANIVIESGTIIAKGVGTGAGIGSGYKGKASNITIKGGTITATSGTRYANVKGYGYRNIGGAGIGSGDNGSAYNIVITGGSVLAKAEETDAKPIGKGSRGTDITPTNGSENVYLMTIANPDGKLVYINNTTTLYEPSNHSSADSSDTNLYVYLPAGSPQSPNVVKLGNVTTKYYYDTTNSKWIEVVDIPEADSSEYIYNGNSQSYQIAQSTYYTASGITQTNPGDYTITLALNDTANTVWSDGTTSNKEYTFTIKKKSAPDFSDINKSYNWGVSGQQTADGYELPADTGTVGNITTEITSDVNSVLVADSASFDKDNSEISYTLNSNTRAKIGSTATIKVTIPTQNYENIIINAVITITDKSNRNDKPTCTLTLSYDDSNNYTATIASVEGAEYSFDGTNWNDVNTKSVAHTKTITGYIRYKETADTNASGYNSDSKATGHGTLSYVSEKDATVTEVGNTEYWYCSVCKKYYSDENAKKEIKLSDIVIAKLTPSIIKGEGQSVTEGEKKELGFTSNASFEDFIRVEIDGKPVDRINYTIKSGSTVVTLNADYVATLSAGEHTIGVVSQSGTATAKFTVNKNKDESKSPLTGDNSDMFLWLALLLASGGAVTATALTSRKRNYNR